MRNMARLTDMLTLFELDNALTIIPRPVMPTASRVPHTPPQSKVIMRISLSGVSLTK